MGSKRSNGSQLLFQRVSGGGRRLSAGSAANHFSGRKQRTTTFPRLYPLGRDSRERGAIRRSHSIVKKSLRHRRANDRRSAWTQHRNIQRIVFGESTT